MNLSVALGLVIIAALAALCYAAFSFFKVKKLEEGTDRMQEIAAAIRLGANTFIRYEYKILIVVVLVVAVVLALLISWQAAVAFIIGTVMSGAAGYVGMKIATYANVRVSNKARVTGELGETLKVAFRGGSVMGLCVGGFALLGIFLVYLIFGVALGQMDEVVTGAAAETWNLFGLEAGFTMTLSSYALGCSIIAMFNRVGGGIYTKAADMGADLVGKTEAQDIQSVEWIKILPYLVVLGTAIAGMNVALVLILGIATTGVIGLFTGSIGLFDWLGSMGTGITGMGELIIITLMAGGMLELIRFNGGVDYIIQKLTKHVNSKRGAELCIAALVSIANFCTANNTIAIITVGPLANDIATRYRVDKRKSASILDTFSCVIQGIIPYGAQMLIAAKLASLSPLSIIEYLYYPVAIGIFALLSIFLRYPRRYS